MTDFSYQLYCSRNFPPLADTLKMLAAAGYTGVEGYGALYADEDKVAELNEQPRRQRPEDADRPLRPRHARAGAGPRARDRQGGRHRDDLLPLPAARPAPRQRRGLASPSASACRRPASPTATPASASAGTTTTSSSRRLADGAAPAGRDLRGRPRPRMGGRHRLGDQGRRRPARVDQHLRRPHHRGARQGHRPRRRERRRGRLGRRRPRHRRLEGADGGAAARPTCKYFVMEHDNPKDAERFAERSIAAAQKL